MRDSFGSNNLKKLLENVSETIFGEKRMCQERKRA